jgi:dienelactone hydrolase/predicted Ser/Thr protein kinase
VGPYEILARIGAGGMGVVYRARDSRLERDVAIKFLPPDILHDEAARRRFRKEALALAKVNHQNIAAVFDVGTVDGADYLVMEYVPGESLAQKLKSGPLRPVEALSVGEEVARALEEAHERGIIHRDLKPANIVVTPKGHAKVLDFGLAKLLSAADEADQALTVSQTKGVVGTPLYMSPEQARGAPIDWRTDLWGLGAVLYESLAGRPPFDGSGLAVLRAITEEKPKPLRELRPDTPQEAEQIVTRALEKDSTKRYQSASEMAHDLSAAIVRLSAPAVAPAPRELRVSLKYVIPAALLILASAAAAGWFYHRSEQRRWAQDVAIPQISKLEDDRQALAAFLVLQKAERYLPGDARLAQLAQENTQVVSITSSPPGATVEIKDYLSPASAWYALGTTPLNNIRIPTGYFRWRIAKQGVGEELSAPYTMPNMNFALDSEVAAPAGMSFVGATRFDDFIGFVGLVGPYELPAYYIDRYEVTNSKYQEFVDTGGYQNRAYWTNKFVRDGRDLSWEEAMMLFRDSTGRSGPSTWEGGHYPAGQGDYPVSGVSWYEASAYAAFARKSLPAFAQWYTAASVDSDDYIVQDSNISLSKLAPVGMYQGLGMFGTYDMAGNVREWAENDTGEGTKFILGGAWGSPTYLYADPEALSPFDRSPENGFRCVRNTGPLPAEAERPVKKLERDFSKYKPVSDDVFRAYLALYSYDKSPLDAKVEGVVGETADWREEKITYDAAYNNQRMTAYLFLPKNVRPPYQTVVFSPSARVLDLRDSRNLGDIKFFDYVVQSGRAVLYPVFYGTYERQGKTVFVGAAQKLTYLANRSKDLGRSLDYLDTRPDIDRNKIAYLGVSMGSAEGVIYTTIEQSSLKTVILLDGGYFLDRPPAGGDQADFAPRLKVPVLMVNGRADYVFSVNESQNPLFQMLGTPDADKKHVVLDTPHDVTERRTELAKVVIDWLDKYLGRVY